MAFAVVACCDYGVPQLRKRVIAGTPRLVQRLVARKGAFPAPLAAVASWTPPPPGKDFVRYPKFHRRRPGEATRHVMTKKERLVRSVHGPTYTIARRPLYWCDEDGEQRTPLTPRECARLQTFDDRTVLPSKPQKLARLLVGNAVPPRLARLLLEP